MGVLATLALILGLLALLTPPVRSPSEGDTRWGPIAAVNVGESNMQLEALLAGTIRITDSCVFVEDAVGDQIFLVWPSDRTRWDPSTRAVLLADTAGTIAALRDGQRVSLGGGGSSVGEGGLGGIGWAIGLDWASLPPDGTCDMDARWFVDDATVD